MDIERKILTYYDYQISIFRISIGHYPKKKKKKPMVHYRCKVYEHLEAYYIEYIFFG
jgi:hypothetical protein